MKSSSSTSSNPRSRSGARAIAITLVLGAIPGLACTHSTRARGPLPAKTLPPVPAVRATTLGPEAADAVDAPRADDSEQFRHAIALPKCGTEDAAKLRKELKDLNGRIDKDLAKHERGEGPWTTRVDEELAALWVHPCLSHIARFFPRPVGSAQTLARLWQRGLGASLLSSAGSVYRRDERNYLVVPPENPQPLPTEARRSVAAWRCVDGEPPTSCLHANSYIARAEDSFNVAERLAHALQGTYGSFTQGGDPMAGGLANLATRRHPCEPIPTVPFVHRHNRESAPPQTPFESFALCAASEAPTTWRYPAETEIRLRARDRGWLVLRGRRGHYQFADEIRAYDLATGAAYIARSESALVLAGLGGVDFASVNAKRKTEVLTGQVSRDQVRELAFILATRRVVRPLRSEVQLVPLAPDLPITLTPDRGAESPFDVPVSTSSTSADTTIHFELSHAGETIMDGTFVWGAATAVDTHAVDLVQVLEAGFGRGCTVVGLPAGITTGRHGKVHSIDADPGSQNDVFADLARGLDRVAQQSVCSSTKR